MIHALHGNFGLPSDWEAALPTGVAAKAWHLWEIRRAHPETRTLTGFATWFNSQIETFPPDPQRILAGYSLGGRLALHVLADRPALWHRALVISTHPGLSTEEERNARQHQDAVWKKRCLTAPWPEVRAAWDAQPVLQSMTPSSDTCALESWRQEMAGAFEGWSLGHQENLLPILARKPCPGLWLAGADDSKFSKLARLSTKCLPHFKNRIIPHSGHRLLADHPEGIKNALLQLVELKALQKGRTFRSGLFD